ncbi:hypothetical protein SASPL_102911 [Salvia splendens]|uniref:EXS domain-containing protein n=1 Tax=Salvia splendens TaxID=180675 RepID=A0A8X8YUP1_SALSN|nr:hypothetical protein SASPL_102911 [Salvia splendens]
MKGGSTALSSVAIVPSPLLLWRLKVFLLVHPRLAGHYCFSSGVSVVSRPDCCPQMISVCFFYVQIEWDSVMRMSADLRDLFLYEAFLYYNPLLLVTMMVWLWGINLWVFAQSNIGYVKIFDLDQSHLTHREIWKLYYFIQAITFADFFLADIFTSMSKVFSDLERSVCRMVHRQKDTRKNITSKCFKVLHSTAVAVIFLSALKYHVSPEKWTNIYRSLWLSSSVLNSFYWDITWDWDLSDNTIQASYDSYDPCLQVTIWEQSSTAMHVDIQVVCPSAPQPPHLCLQYQ